MQEKSEEEKTRKVPPKEPSVIDNENQREQPVTTPELEQEEIYLVELEAPQSSPPSPTSQTNPSQKKATNKKSKKKPTPIKKIEPKPSPKQTEKPSTKKKPTKAPSTKLTPASTPVQPALINPLINTKDDQDLKKLLIYLDELLSHLPEEKINQFTHSKYYTKYMELFKKLKI